MPTAALLDKLIWWLIYGGLFGVALGLAMAGIGAAAGFALAGVGGAVVVVGVVLIWVRSRMEPEQK